MALGIAYPKKGDLALARAFTSRALAIDPKNPVALKNLSAILGREGDSLRALYFLRQSYQIDPKDPQTVYGLAFAFMEMGDIEPAQRHFQMVLESQGPMSFGRYRRGPSPPWSCCASCTPASRGSSRGYIGVDLGEES